MAGWHGPQSGDCSCCEDAGGGGYGAPWYDAGTAAYRLEQWDLIGVTDANSQSGVLPGEIVTQTFADTEIRLYSDAARTNLVAIAYVPFVFTPPGTVTFVEQNGSGISGTVVYTFQTTAGTEQFAVSGTAV